MDSMGGKTTLLAITDDVVISVSAVLNAAKELGDVVVEQCDTRIITQALSLSQLMLEPSSVDIVISISRLGEFPGDQLFGQLFSVLKHGGTIIIHRSVESATVETDKAISTLERKLLLAGFLEARGLKLMPTAGLQSYGVKAKKPSWKIGSSFVLKKTDKSLPKVQIDDDLDLIDEDSLLTEEDLKKPQLPSVDDCEVGKTRKACRNCSCGRAEEEEKVKLGLTDDQLDNPQSACGSCGLGDAFRCGTCPYKGLPPFKLGEKVSLPGNFLAADI